MKLLKLVPYLLTAILGLLALNDILGTYGGRFTQFTTDLIRQLDQYTPGSILYHFDRALCGNHSFHLFDPCSRTLYVDPFTGKDDDKLRDFDKFVCERYHQNYSALQPCDPTTHTVYEYLTAVIPALGSFISGGALNSAMLVGTFLLVFAIAKQTDNPFLIVVFPFVFPFYASIVKFVLISIFEVLGGLVAGAVALIGYFASFFGGLKMLAGCVEAYHGVRATKHITDEIKRGRKGS
jgi:hypothetical protein